MLPVGCFHGGGGFDYLCNIAEISMLVKYVCASSRSVIVFDAYTRRDVCMMHDAHLDEMYILVENVCAHLV